MTEEWGLRAEGGALGTGEKVPVGLPLPFPAQFPRFSVCISATSIRETDPSHVLRPEQHVVGTQ